MFYFSSPKYSCSNSRSITKDPSKYSDSVGSGACSAFKIASPTVSASTSIVPDITQVQGILYVFILLFITSDFVAAPVNLIYSKLITRRDDCMILCCILFNCTLSVTVAGVPLANNVRSKLTRAFVFY